MSPCSLVRLLARERIIREVRSQSTAIAAAYTSSPLPSSAAGNSRVALETRNPVSVTRYVPEGVAAAPEPPEGWEGFAGSVVVEVGAGIGVAVPLVAAGTAVGAGSGIAVPVVVAGTAVGAGIGVAVPVVTAGTALTGGAACVWANVVCAVICPTAV